MSSEIHDIRPPLKAEAPTRLGRLLRGLWEGCIRYGSFSIRRGLLYPWIIEGYWWWVLQLKGASWELWWVGGIVDSIWLGICSECSLCTLSRTTPGCSLCTLSRTTPSCSLCTLSRTTPGCSLCTLSSTTGSLRGGSFASPLWMRVAWGSSIGVISLWES
jgi:hypothetical protein